MKRKIKCLICKKNNWDNLYTNLLKCKTCGFVRARDKYFKIKPSQLYDLNYFSGIDYEDYKEEKEALIQNFENRLEKIRKFKKSGILLEIGCAFGYFLSVSEKKFKTIGIDLHKDITKIAKKNTTNTKILTGDFIDAKIKKESVDVVCMFDVIEHLKDPDKYLQKINQILKKNGLVIIETGDIETLLPKVQRDKWRLITPPTHLYYFSEKSLKEILAKNGFKILKTHHVPFYRTFNQTVFRLTRNKLLTKIMKRLNFTYAINTFDLIFIVAQKLDLS